MAGKIFNVKLACGCMVAEDKDNPGWSSCYSEYSDDDEQVSFHEKCVLDYFTKKKSENKKKKMLNEHVEILLPFTLMLVSLLLINLFFVEELGGWRYIGVIGFLIFGLFFNRKIL